MKKSNFIVLGISAIAAALLLALWYYLGFNHIDNPFDLVLAIVWWVGIVVIAVVIARLERQRQRQIRTIYVSPTALYNSESGVVGLKGVTAVEGMQSILRNLKYGFDKRRCPSRLSSIIALWCKPTNSSLPMKRSRKKALGKARLFASIAKTVTRKSTSTANRL